MALTTQQKATLKAYILADPTLNAFPANSDGAYEIAARLNVAASPEFIVWKTNVNPDEIMRNGMDWTRVDNLSVGKARIWDWLTKLGTFNAAKVNVRAGIDATWVGTAADLAVRAQVYTHCKRSATVIEKLFAAGAGSDASPATMDWEGAISYQDVQVARESA
jgi:hypothetical protein